MNGKEHSYDQRSAAPVGEPLFEAWCADMGYRCIRFNIDEAIRIERYWEINPILRNAPDYLVITPKGKRMVQVKGTFNLKQDEYNMIQDFIKHYATPECPLYYAFCVMDRDPVVVTAEYVQTIYNKSWPTKEWPDRKKYKSLKFPNDLFKDKWK